MKQTVDEFTAIAFHEFLIENFGAIWKRHVEVGFIVRCDGSEENKIALRDGN